MTDDTHIDLTALDPTADPARIERSAHLIAMRVAPSLRARHERAPVVWLQLAQWRRPVLATAALVAIVSVTVLALPQSTPVAAASAGAPTLAEAEGVPASVAGWVENGTPPSDEALLELQETP